MDTELQRAILLKEKLEEEWKLKRNVNAVDVGLKYVDGKMTDQMAIRAYVDQKANVPPQDAIPSSVEGIPTDVIEKREKFVLQSLEATAEEDASATAAAGQIQSPLSGGMAIGPCRSIRDRRIWGTVGAFVQKEDGKTYALSCFHVLCGDSGWKPGDQLTQLSREGVCTEDALVGMLADACLRGNFGRIELDVDGALAEIVNKEVAWEIPGIGRLTGTADTKPGTRVRKVGSATGLTYGIVEGLNKTITVDFFDGIGEVTFTRSIRIVPDTRYNAKFSTKGDSGAVIVNEQNQVVGLLFAGTDDEAVTIANNIAEVVQSLKITGIGGAGGGGAH
ncbi:hypothetical protein MKX46_02585 [Paenibacillus sp. FSL P4-0113]|uniref:hypothetical protein n=1 Tax=Paenibacillus sp. FSL P4-0113 TaxID=2921630 RepID=UPI0030FA3364